MFEGDLALQVWLESCVPFHCPSLRRRSFFVLCKLMIQTLVYGCSTRHALPFCLGRWFAHLSVYQSHLEGLQSPILLDLSPQSVLGETWKTGPSAGLWATLRTTLQTMTSLTKMQLPSDCCALNLRGQWEWSGSKSTAWSLKTRVPHCTCALVSCVTLGKPQHSSVPVAASQAQGCDEVGDCYSGCF